MANPWDNDPIMGAPASAPTLTPNVNNGIRNPWDNDPVVGAAPVTPLTASGLVSQTMSGVNEGMVGRFFGAPVDLANYGLGAAFNGINKLAGTNLQTSTTPFLGSNWINQRQNDIGTVTAPSNNPIEQGARYVAGQVGTTIPLAIASGGLAPAAAILTSGLTSAAGGTAGNKVGQWVANKTGGDPQQGGQIGQALGETLGYGVPLAASAATKAMIGPGPDLSKINSVGTLRAQAGDLYEQGKAWGNAATPEQTTNIADTLRQIAKDHGTIDRNGNVLQGYGPINGALQLADQYAGDTMLPSEMRIVHEALQNAAENSEPRVALVGDKMKQAFNQWVDPLVPEFGQADPLWSRAARAQAIQQAIDRGNIKTSLFTGSGKENGLRTTFRQLQSGIVGTPGEQGNPIGFQPHEIAAIDTVANGAPGANLARNFGKLAPRGAVTVLGDAGVPFMIGNAIGGPVLGTASSAVTAGLGEIGRRIATPLIENAANRALATTLSGGKPVPSLPFKTQNMDALINALYAAPAGEQAKQDYQPHSLAGALVGQMR